MRRVASKLVSRGIHAFRLDMRGAGASQPHCHKMNHAGRSDDLLAATHRIAELLPDSKITVIGFSLGAAMTVRMLGAHPEQLPDQLQNALAIAPPIDLSYCCWQIQRGFNRMYDWTMARWMYRQVLDRRHANAAIQQLDTGRPPKSIRAFDSQFTAPLGGFASVDDYYTQASAAQFVPRIAVPTCILAAADDPVVPIRIFDQRQLAPSVDLWTTHHGGHLGFLAARGKDPDPWWLDWRIVDFVSSGKLPSMIGSDAR
jgi:predicted alpha/beta-fold hydrolase